MSTHVVSVRIQPQTIAKCYLLYHQAGSAPYNLPISRVIGKLLTGLVDLTYDQYNLEDIPDERTAREVILRYLKQADLFITDPDKIKRGLTDLLREQEPIEQEGDIVTATEVVMKESAEDLEERRKRIAEHIENLAQNVEAQADDALRSAMMVEHTEPQAEQPLSQNQRPPWELSEMISEDVAKTTVAYTAATKEENELLKKAVRVAYAGVPQSMWDTEVAMNVIASTYNILKRYKEE